MARTLSAAERDELRYTWLTPAMAAPRIGGVRAAKVVELIKAQKLRALDINPDGKRPEYRIRPEWVDEYLEAYTQEPHAA